MSDKDRELDLNTAMALTQRLLDKGDDASAIEVEAGSARFGQNLRYWLWRAGGRKRMQVKDAGHLSRMLDNYEIELERLRQTHGRDLLLQKQAHDRMVKEIEAAHRQSVASQRAEIVAEAAAGTERLRRELTRERNRIAQLEQLVAEFQRVYQGELVKARETGWAEGAAALGQANQRVAELERTLAEQAERAALDLRDRLAEESAHADAMIDALRAELAETRALAESELEQVRANALVELAEARTLADEDLARARARAEAALVETRTLAETELAETRAFAESEMAQARAAWQAEAEAERTLLTAKREQAEAELRKLREQADSDKARALEQAERRHHDALAALRTRHAEELAEIRTGGEWSLSDAKRQIADLRLRLNEQDEAHAEEIDALRRQHKVELAQWLERFEQAQAHQEIRHAGEYAGSQQAVGQELELARAEADDLRAQLHEQAERRAAAEAEQQAAAQARLHALTETLERERGRLANLAASLAEAETRADRLSDELAEALRPRPAETGAVAQLAQEREAHARLLEQWRDELEGARAAAEAAHHRAARAEAERVLAEKRADSLTEQMNALRDGGERSTLQQTEMNRLTEEHTLAMARLRLDSSRRIAELERLLEQTQRQPAPAPQPMPEASPAAATPEEPRPGDWSTRLRVAMERAERAEAEANLSANKIEVLKDALALAKTRSGGGAPEAAPSADYRFRDVKRAFARAFHPDQGGREHPDKAALFLEFWPVFERIGKDEDYSGER